MSIGKIYGSSIGNSLILLKDFADVIEWKSSKRVVAKTELSCGDKVWIFEKVSENVSVTDIPHIEKADLYPELCNEMKKEKLHAHFADQMEAFELLSKHKKSVISF
ncbi:MAG: hypothetical protein MH321_08885 [Leptospiraceae bacterium]|nr:hypothetical protein [Leptospiraceae bacterium]